MAMLGQNLARAAFRLVWALASGFSFCVQCEVGSSLVLRRPIETTALIGHYLCCHWTAGRRASRANAIITAHGQFAGVSGARSGLLAAALIMKTRWKWAIPTARKRDLLLCREIFSFSAPCTPRLDFQPLANVEHEGLAADCVPYEWMPHVLPPKAQDFANILIKDWVSIPPNHFSGATIGLDPSMYPELRVAGHYRLSATYSSGGLLESYCYYELKPFPKEVANLPAKSWQGVAYSNSVAVYVRKKKS